MSEAVTTVDGAHLEWQVRDLRDRLLKKSRSSENPNAEVVREGLFDRILASRGYPREVEKSLTWTFSEISSNGLATDAGLVADSVSSWRIVYPQICPTVLMVLRTLPASYIKRAGEGIVTGLLELFEHEVKADDLFVALSKGSIVSSMRNSLPSESGRGRLSTALSAFVSRVGERNCRFPQIMLLLLRYKMLLEEGVVVSPLRNSIVQEPKDFLEYFAGELAAKALLAGSTAFRLHLLSPFIEAHFKEWMELLKNPPLF